MSVIRDLTISKGLKRRVVAALALIADILHAVPGAEPVIIALNHFIALFGGVAVTHAGASGTLSKEKLATAVALLYVLIAVAYWYPPLYPALPYLYKAAGLLAALRVGGEVVEYSQRGTYATTEFKHRL